VTIWRAKIYLGHGGEEGLSRHRGGLHVVDDAIEAVTSGDAMDILVRRYNVPPEDVILRGQSERSFDFLSDDWYPRTGPGIYSFSYGIAKLLVSAAVMLFRWILGRLARK
jgi:hypothetical protein